MTETYRPVRESDFNHLHEIVSNWEVVRQLGGWPWPPQEAHTRQRSKPYAGDGFVWAICRDDRHIGSIGVTGKDLGYMLHPDFHGQGIMTRALTKAIIDGFLVLKRQTLTASTWIDNDGSHALLTNAGFQHFRTDYMRSKARGYPVLTRHYRLTMQDWQTLRAEAE